MRPLLIDIHTHIYPPAYLSLLRSRKDVPYLLEPASDDTNGSKLSPPRLIILPTDDDPSVDPAQRGRPIDSSYSSVAKILHFMDTHGIQISILSLANPWLDFLAPSEGLSWALRINEELDSISRSSHGRLFGFGTLPLSAPTPDVCQAITDLQRFDTIRGVIMGTSGLGQGLDDPALDPVFEALERSQRMVFLHPHYGLPSSVFGPRAAESGHVLHLSLGFPLETTIAFTRMFLSKVFDRFPGLKVLIAHAGATVPYLAGRITSCIEHERHYHDDNGKRVAGPMRSLQDVLGTNIWLDAVAYSSTSVKAAAELVGKERVMFGTDHPFFPPLEPGAREWQSVKSNMQGIREAFAGDDEAVDAVLNGNATKLFGLPTR